MLPPAILLMGPTAAGKTDLAIRLCQRLPCSLVSVDSALVYRGMDIGTAKPDPAILKEYPHRLIDIRDPAEPYSAAEFRRDALQVMAEISQAGRIPLLVGGTMLYFKVLLEGLAELPAADPAIREQIDREAAQHGWAHIHAQLAAVDPESAARIHPTDPQRLQRALEVFRATGQTLTERHQAGQQEATGLLPYQLLQVAMAPAHRATLHARIASRFDQMLAAGFVEEVQQLYVRGDLHAGLPSLRAVGYRQIWNYLAGNLNYADMRERGVIATRQLAKRQLTWLRSWPDLSWIITNDTEQNHDDNLRLHEDFIVDNALKLLESTTK